MRKRKVGEENHNWGPEDRRVTVRGRQQPAKACTRCGMERTKDPDTKTLYLFRDRGADHDERWTAFKSGVLPACDPPLRTPAESPSP